MIKLLIYGLLMNMTLQIYGVNSCHNVFFEDTGKNYNRLSNKHDTVNCTNCNENDNACQLGRSIVNIINYVTKVMHSEQVRNKEKHLKDIKNDEFSEKRFAENDRISNTANLEQNQSADKKLKDRDNFDDSELTHILIKMYKTFVRSINFTPERHEEKFSPDKSEMVNKFNKKAKKLSNSPNSENDDSEEKQQTVTENNDIIPLINDAINIFKKIENLTRMKRELKDGKHGADRTESANNSAKTIKILATVLKPNSEQDFPEEKLQNDKDNRNNFAPNDPSIEMFKIVQQLINLQHDHQEDNNPTEEVNDPFLKMVNEFTKIFQIKNSTNTEHYIQAPSNNTNQIVENFINIFNDTLKELVGTFSVISKNENSTKLKQDQDEEKHTTNLKDSKDGKVIDKTNKIFTNHKIDSFDNNKHRK